MADYSDLIAFLLSPSGTKRSHPELMREAAAALQEQARELDARRDNWEFIQSMNEELIFECKALRAENETLRNDLAACTDDLHEKYQADLQREGDHYRELLAEAEKNAECADNQRNQARIELRDIAADLRNQRDTFQKDAERYQAVRIHSTGPGWPLGSPEALDALADAAMASHTSP